MPQAVKIAPRDQHSPPTDSGPLTLDRPCFRPDADADPAALAEELAAELARLEKTREDDPFSNPVMLLAVELSRRLEAGGLSYAALEQAVQHLTAEGFVDRARRLGRYIGECDPAANDGKLRDAFTALARPRNAEEVGNDGGDVVRFEIFRDRVESESFGIVITAHPTFNISTELMRALAALASGRGASGEALSEDEREALVALARQAEHRPDDDISLAREHALSVEAIEGIQTALRRAYDILFQTARELYPKRWIELKPRLLTVASWVGYDLDGRSDITWTDTLHKRLRIQKAQLERYLADLRDLRGDLDANGRELRDTLDLMESRLALAITQASDEIAVFGNSDAGGEEQRERVKEISRRMFEGRSLRLADSSLLVEMLDRAIGKAEGRKGAEGLVRRLCVLRAEMANHGLGLAHTHVRINATQVHNAIRKAVGLVTHPNDPRYRVSYTDTINELLDQVRPETINFGSVMGERTSVKRLFMVVAQMLKYSDATAPVRFLIAECESAFTALTALYYAKLFGVDRHVDISPLFETEKALEAGSRVIEQLLENPHYRAYVEARGRICVQTGYSDAGRYLGQSPAAASIERLRLRLIRVMAKHGLRDVRLLIFDTHGELIGRGAHPESFEQRLSYVDTPASRGFMSDEKVLFKQEVSFQGGDGYLYFINPAAAFASVTRILEHALRHGDNSVDDPFYDEAAYIREFFTTVKEFQVGLMDDKNYGVLLSAFGPSLLFQSGSRAFKREHEDSSEIDYAEASQFRAIPHNAILQQLGLLANSVGGAGAAIARDPEKFRELYPRSARLRQLMGILEYGAAVSDPEIMRGYVDSLDPSHWIVRAGDAASPRRADEMLRLADQLEGLGLHERQNKVFRRLNKDFTILSAALEELGAEGCGALVDGRTKIALRVLHAIRLAVIHEIFLLATRIPEFSSRHSMTPRQLVIRLLHLDVPPVARLLEEIFPLTEGDTASADFGEPASYHGDEKQSYQFENETIFRPMKGLYTLVRRISTANIHRIGFLG